MALFRCASGSSGGGETLTLLWSNGDTTATLSGVSATGLDLSLYDEIKVEYYDTTSNSKLYSIKIVDMPDRVILGDYTSNNGGWCRVGSKASNTTFEFGECFQMLGSSKNNNRIIIKAIYGVTY